MCPVSKSKLQSGGASRWRTFWTYSSHEYFPGDRRRLSQWTPTCRLQKQRFKGMHFLVSASRLLIHSQHQSPAEMCLSVPRGPFKPNPAPLPPAPCAPTPTPAPRPPTPAAPETGNKNDSSSCLMFTSAIVSVLLLHYLPTSSSCPTVKLPDCHLLPASCSLAPITFILLLAFLAFLAIA